MSSNFDLVITADYPSRTAELHLLGDDGSQLAFRQTKFEDISVSRQRGLFDLRNYLRHYVEPGHEAASVKDIGVCIAEQVLGQEIFRQLWQSEAQRTLRIQLPGASEEENHLAAALARVPWEIARPAPDRPTLGERNLLVRVVHDMRAPATQPLELGDDEPLRVLFVFAEARGSRPLAARRERQELRTLFEKEIYPDRRVEADFLTHGVTRERLESELVENDGYHIVHWSGHGHLNLLELSRPDGRPDMISGDDLLAFFQKAGVFPRLFFLSACHSGDILLVKDWNDFLDVAAGRERTSGMGPLARPKMQHGDGPGGPSYDKQIELETQPGYTGTAHALLQGGVSSVVAMRYAVGDEYARDLGVEFYRAVLAQKKPKSVAAALTFARKSLLDPKKHDPARYAVCDHATPVLYGDEHHGLPLPAGRSECLDTRDRRLHRIVELTSAAHEHFVGRTWELAGLGAEFIGSRSGDEVKPVATITGLGGMGKTALVAEALSMWESRFEWVLLYQAKPNPLGLDATLRDIHMKLNAELGRYHNHVKSRPADAVYRDSGEDFRGPQRNERLIRNLVRAMRDEPILLVLDNFETNLKPRGNISTTRKRVSSDGDNSLAGASCLYGTSPCQDPAWDDCLAKLATELIGTSSRVLITCRRPLAALAGGASHPVLLGPLPPGEAALFLRTHPALSQMLFSADEAEKALAMRLLNASRFHPLLMDRLARLAGDAARRPLLLEALDTLEKTKDFAQLPALFAVAGDSAADDAQELAYLDDALATSLDQLVAEASPDARRLLWTIAVANEPVELELLRGVWSGEDNETEQLRQIKQMLDMLELLPPELQEKAKEELPPLPPEFRAMLDALPPQSEAASRPEIEPLLGQLVAVGLVTEECIDSRLSLGESSASFAERKVTLFTCHELVRERIKRWMEQHPHDRAELTENAIRLAYAERLEAAFEALQHQNMTAALQAGSQAVVYCVQSEAWDRLGGFAGGVVTSTGDPRLLDALIPHLQTAADAAPEGKSGCSCLSYLADALWASGRADTSLLFYEQAAIQTRAIAEEEGEDARPAWANLAVLTANWANALRDSGNLNAARQRQIEAADWFKKTEQPDIHVIGCELEALRIDVMQGGVDTALPQLEVRLAKVKTWWNQHCAGQAVPEAPNSEFLAHTYISALNIAAKADIDIKDSESALKRVDAAIDIMRKVGLPTTEIAGTRMNRAIVLQNLGAFGEAQAELEACLDAFHSDPTRTARTLSSLASLFGRQRDMAQAITQERRALALREQLPNPAERALSHDSLAIYLIERSGISSALAESPRHRLAALIYRLVAGLGQDLQDSMHNYAIDFRRACEAGTELAVPRVAELLADSAFHPLEEWLRQRQVDTDELQAAVDQFLAQARQAAEKDS